MVENVLILNEATTKYRVKFYSGNKNYFRVHIGDKIVKFPDNCDGLYLSKLENNFFSF